MKKWTMQAYRAPEDGEALLALVSRRDAERAADYPGLLDLQEALELETIRRSTRLWWRAPGCLAGFALLDGEMLSMEIAPDTSRADLAGEMLCWAEDWLRGSEGEARTIRASCRRGNRAQMDILEALGFRPEPVRTLHFRRDLTGPIPPAKLPTGFRIRPLEGEQEVERHVALHRAAFETEEMTVEIRLAMMRTPEYDRTLDLVATAPDGELAAYVMCHIQPRENALRGIQAGYTDPVATHPKYQRLGLARALLLEGLRLLKAHGMVCAELGTYSENIAMIQTALAVGFVVYDETIFYTRGIS